MSHSAFYGGAPAGGNQFSNFGIFSGRVYSKPGYLMRAAQRKYGHNIWIIGTDQSQLERFWSKVEVKASNFRSERPKEISRTVVDITAKEHVNKGAEPDTIEIINAQTEKRSQRKLYTLTFQKGWEFGGSIDVGASFFNVLGTGGPSFGLAGFAKHSRTTTKEDTTEELRSLSQQYESHSASLQLHLFRFITSPR